MEKLLAWFDRQPLLEQVVVFGILLCVYCYALVGALLGIDAMLGLLGVGRLFG